VFLWVVTSGLVRDTIFVYIRISIRFTLSLGFNWDEACSLKAHLTSNLIISVV